MPVSIGRVSSLETPRDALSLGTFAGRILDDLDVWLNVHDAEYNMLVWNRAAERLSGYPAEEVLGHARVWDWCYPDAEYRRTIIARARGIVEEGVVVGGFQNEIVCRDGKRRCMSWNSSRIVDDDGTVRGAIVVGYEVTELQRSRDKLRRLNEELSVLYDVASVASESVELSVTLDRCLERVLRALPADGGLIHVLEVSPAADGEARLVLAAHSGVDGALLRLVRAAPASGLVGEIFSTGEPLRLDDLRLDERVSPEALASGVVSFAGVPMRARGRTLGVFSLLSSEPGGFSDEDLPLLVSVGDQIGLTVDHARLQDQAARVAVLEERRRLARELHDAVSQSLYSLTLFAEAGRRHLSRGELDQAEENLERLAQTSQETFREMRLLVHELRPLELEERGLEGALRRRLEAVEGRTGVEFDLEIENGLVLPGRQEEALYRVAQEALNNTLRHARAKRVVISVTREDSTTRLEVRDDGIGFDPLAAGRGGLGLRSIRERVDRIDGSLDVDSRPGGGTRIVVHVPVEGEGAS